MFKSLFEKFASWKKSTTVPQEKIEKSPESPEMRLHRRDSMLLDLLNLLEERRNIPGKRGTLHRIERLLTQLHPFAEEDADTAGAMLKTIDALAETDPAEAIETLRLISLHLTDYDRQQLSATPLNIALSRKCISLSEDDSLEALYVAVSFAPSLTTEAVSALDRQINAMEPAVRAGFINENFSHGPGRQPEFETVVLAAAKKIASALDPDQEVLMQRIIASFTGDMAERNNAADRWFSLVTSSVSREVALHEIDRQRYDNLYTPDILRDHGIRAQLILADKGVTSEKTNMLRNAAYDSCNSGNESLSRLAAERWVEYASDRELVDEASWSGHYMNDLARERILRLADVRKPQDAVRLLDYAARRIEKENYGRPESFYQQVLEKWATLLKDKIDPEQAFVHAKHFNHDARFTSHRSVALETVFMTLADKLPVPAGVESARMAFCKAANNDRKPESIAAAEKWAALVGKLPPAEGIAEVKHVRENYSGGCSLRQQADILGPEICKKTACGISPAEFARRLTP